MKRFEAWPQGSPWHESASALSDNSSNALLVLGGEINVEAVAKLWNELEERLARVEVALAELRQLGRP